MHKLDRSSVAAPGCLDDYDYKTQTWDDFGGACKKALRAALVQMQGIPGVAAGVRCAYCEGLIFYGGHIEHFRRKSLKHYPELTFDWNNLFLACDARTHCGHHKDRRSAPAYDPNQLIKPDEDDPDVFLYFHSSGEVRVRGKLSAGNDLRAKAKAEVTIQVFCLNDSTLVAERARAVSEYRKMKSDDFEELASWEEVDRREYFESEIEATRGHPFATTIKHFLQNQ